MRENLTVCHKGSCQVSPDESGTWRCPPGEAYAHSLGHLRISHPPPRSHHLSKHPLVVGEAAQQEILDQVRAKPGITLREMLTTLRTATADHVYTLIAQYTIYVDLRPLSLSLIESTYFEARTRPQSTHISRRPGSHPCLDQSFSLVPGTRLSWDDRIWDIINVGDGRLSRGEWDRVITLSPASSSSPNKGSSWASPIIRRNQKLRSSGSGMPAPPTSRMPDGSTTSLNRTSRRPPHHFSSTRPHSGPSETGYTNTTSG